jgi:hypothetical protein
MFYKFLIFIKNHLTKNGKWVLISKFLQLQQIFDEKDLLLASHFQCKAFTKQFR